METATLDLLQDAVPAYARDLKLNLQAVLGDSPLTPAQRLGTALAVAQACGNPALRDALREATLAQAGEAAAEDALAAAALMGMTNIVYRFKHLVGRDEYAALPVRLRMNRIAKTAGPKVDFELFCLAVSAVNGCEACVRAHEKALVEAGLTEAQVFEAVRIAATVHGLACAVGQGAAGPA
jgi:alkyl hydroperoxide reductase subunit D